MQKAGFITPCGPFDEPVSHIRLAVLTVTMTLSVIVSALLLTLGPIQHKIMIDLWDPRYLPKPIVAHPVHVLTISAEGRMTFGGAPVANLVQLRRLLDLDQQAVPLPMLRVEPQPTTRYEDFINVLAVIKRAHVDQYCIDFEPGRRVGELKCPPRPYLL